MKIFKLNNYRGEHTAPSKEFGTSLDNPSDVFPDDIYSSDGARLYGDHFSSDSYCHSIIQNARGNPNYKVRIYRAVPDVNSEINKDIKSYENVISYYNKFNFFPMGNELVSRKKNEIKHLNLDYEEGKTYIYNDLIKELERIEGEKQPAPKINPGDWVSISLDYARQHGKSNLNDSFKIIQKTVTAKELYTDGSINEWGYSP